MATEHTRTHTHTHIFFHSDTSKWQREHSTSHLLPDSYCAPFSGSTETSPKKRPADPHDPRRPLGKQSSAPVRFKMAALAFPCLGPLSLSLVCSGSLCLPLAPPWRPLPLSLHFGCGRDRKHRFVSKACSPLSEHSVQMLLNASRTLGAHKGMLK